MLGGVAKREASVRTEPHATCGRYNKYYFYIIPFVLCSQLVWAERGLLKHWISLEIVNESNLDLPFIFLSGAVGEDLAVQVMKEGAHDYIMKNNFTRLIPAMERELRDAKVRRLRREAEEDMRISEYKHRHLFESLCDAAFLIETETGRIIDTNPQAEVLLGRPRAGILGMRESQLYPEHNEGAAANALLSSGGRFESQVLEKNGGIVPVYVSVSKLQLYDRRFLLALFHDITSRKRSEDKIREQANLLELAHDAIFVRSLEEKIQYWNRGAEQLYGWSATEAIGATSSKWSMKIVSCSLRRKRSF
jgi:PAS domain S-box-containing protein